MEEVNRSRWFRTRRPVDPARTVSVARGSLGSVAREDEKDRPLRRIVVLHQKPDHKSCRDSLRVEEHRGRDH